MSIGMALPPFVRPRQAISDFRGYVGDRRRHTLRPALLASLATILMLYGMFSSFTARVTPPPPEITYVEQWPASRTVVDVRAQQARDAPREIAAKKAKAAAEEKERQAYKRLADKLGIE